MSTLKSISSGVAVASSTNSFVVTGAPSGVGFTMVQNFNNEALGDKPSGWGSISLNQTVISDEESFSGSRAVRSEVQQGANSFGKTLGGVITLPEKVGKGKEIRVRVRTFWPNGSDPQAQNSNLKFLRIHTQKENGENDGYNDWYIKRYSNNEAFYFRYEGQSGAKNTNFGVGKHIVKNQWETYEMYLCLDNVAADSGGKGRMRAWKNGALIADIATEPTLRNSTTVVDSVFLFTFWNNGSPITQHMYIDDLVITTQQPSNTDSSGNKYIGV